MDKVIDNYQEIATKSTSLNLKMSYVSSQYDKFTIKDYTIAPSLDSSIVYNDIVDICIRPRNRHYEFVKNTKCIGCNAPLHITPEDLDTGISKCDYCDTFTQIY